MNLNLLLSHRFRVDDFRKREKTTTFDNSVKPYPEALETYAGICHIEITSLHRLSYQIYHLVNGAD